MQKLAKLLQPWAVNYVGYSFGYLLAVHTAMYYANNGHIIDNLVLIGSPMSKTFLNKLKNHNNIKNIVVIDLRQYGDPIYAGMSEIELGKSIPKLLEQINGNGIGHFYYSANGKEGRSRRYHFALDMKNSGLK